MSVANIFNIPHFIKARTPQQLRAKMLLNNLKMKAECQYFDITFDGKEWVVWYFAEASEKKLTPSEGD